METVQEKTYENIYYLLWEAAQRYQKFTQFRVIGKSHDDRMIPMLEIGTGDLCIFCIAGFSGTDGQMSDRLAETAVELCRNYECGWTVQEFYEVRKLLDQTRLCIIPVVNPDGYEISQTVKLVANIKESTLYPILRKLEQNGYLHTYSKEFQGRNRKYYSITDSGKEQLIFLKKEWNEYYHTIDDIIEGRMIPDGK